MSGLSGVLVIDKPAGISSAKVVAIVKRRCGGAKVGHAGTLDPLATGVLVLAIGSATKQASTLMEGEKGYETQIDLSAFTTTDDTEGPRTEVPVAAPPTREQIERALDAFRGTFMQAPPAFSAVKIDGRRAYDIARSSARAAAEVAASGATDAGADGGTSHGADLALPAPTARPVTTHAVEIHSYEWPMLRLAIRSAKGFYVRSLARDLGRALGTGGHCASIRRTRVGPYTLAQARMIDALPPKLAAADLLTTPAAS
jgi:tRNA pseudouridine55 synthase